MKKYNIAVIKGDGIGPEVVDEALKVLSRSSKKNNYEFETTEFDFGGERYLKTGEVLSDQEVEELRQYDLEDALGDIENDEEDDDEFRDFLGGLGIDLT